MATSSSVEASELATAAWYYRHRAASSTAKTHQQQPKRQVSTLAQPAPPSPPVAMFDFDCNLTHADLAPHVAELLTSAAGVGVTEMLVPGATLEESHAAIALCASHPTTLFPTAGVHPYNAREPPPTEAIDQLRQLLSLDAVRAAGEFGLDYSPSFPDRELQRQWFTSQLDVAVAADKPLFLHERLAHDDFMDILSAAELRAGRKLPPAVVHCFTGTARELDAYVARGFWIGVTGFVCKPTHGAELRDMLAKIPLDRLVVETDAPYMGFAKCRANEASDRKRQSPNVPSALPLVVAAVAKAIGRSPDEVAAITRANARRFLRL